MTRRSTRAEFPASVKAKAMLRAEGRCEGMVSTETGRYAAARGDSGPDITRCSAKVGVGGQQPEFDHIIPDALGGLNDLDNCQVICCACHREKTADDAAAIAKAERMQQRAAGIPKTTKRKLPGHRGDNRKAKVGGGWEPRRK